MREENDNPVENADAAVPEAPDKQKPTPQESADKEPVTEPSGWADAPETIAADQWTVAQAAEGQPAEASDNEESADKALASESPARTDDLETLIEDQGFAYVSVQNARLYASERMTARSLEGVVSGIALATSYVAEDAGTGRPAMLSVMFKAASGLKTGYVLAAEAEVRDYQAALVEMLGDGADLADDLWPLPAPDFAEGDAEEAAPTAEPAPAPYLEITWVRGEESALLLGSTVTLKAQAFNLDEDQIAGYQWKNDANGELEEVPGATESTYTFTASEENTGCRWIAEVLLK
jgi:hypothetical protein